MAEQLVKLEQDADRAAASGNVRDAVQLLERAAASDGATTELWLKLSAMRRAAGDPSGALQATERALALEPLNFFALLSRAHLLDRLSDPRAGEAFAIAAFHAPPEDKLPPPLKQAVDQARQRSDAHQEQVEQRLRAAAPQSTGSHDGAEIQRFITNISRRTRHFHQEPTHFHYPGLPEIEFHDRARFPELDRLEAAAPVIRDEFKQLIAAEAGELVAYVNYPDRVPVGQWKELNRSRKWTAIHLLRTGQAVEANARHCPQTMAVLAAMPQPQVPGASPNAMFSLLAPNTRIPPHTGVANTRLVCHLPLIVPGQCGFRVGNSSREWREGEAFVFDDTIEHEAWNDSGELRVVLILDLWPPALSRAARDAVAAIIPVTGVSFTGGM
jgi:aspartyl/asparaginyl beta-hydroxylase (cupin superfamily)